MKSHEIEKMSTNEKILSMELLWDSLTHKDHKIESPEWHKNIINTRIKKIESGNAIFIPINDLVKPTK